MKRSPFHKPKQVLVFNGAYVLIGILRSIRSAAEHSGTHPQAISLACSGDNVTSGKFYYRHIHPNVEIELADLDTLKLQEYDKMCNVNRKYITTREMAKRRKVLGGKRKSNSNNNGYGEK